MSLSVSGRRSRLERLALARFTAPLRVMPALHPCRRSLRLLPRECCHAYARRLTQATSASSGTSFVLEARSSTTCPARSHYARLRNTGRAMGGNLDLVRSICEPWACGDFRETEWA